MRFKRATQENLMAWVQSLGAAIFVLMFMVWQHVQAQHLERELKGMRKEEDELIFQNSRLQSQINQWVSPSHLEIMARKELGMQPLDAQHRVRVELP